MSSHDVAEDRNNKEGEQVPLAWPESHLKYSIYQLCCPVPYAELRLLHNVAQQGVCRHNIIAGASNRSRECTAVCISSSLGGCEVTSQDAGALLFCQMGFLHVACAT